MAAPTITSATVSNSGHELTLVFSAAVNQVVPTGITLKNGTAVKEVTEYKWLSSTSLRIRMNQFAVKSDTVTYVLSSCNISDVATSTAIANVASGSSSNTSTARPLRSHNGARGRY